MSGRLTFGRIASTGIASKRRSRRMFVGERGINVSRSDIAASQGGLGCAARDAAAAPSSV